MKNKKKDKGIRDYVVDTPKIEKDATIVSINDLHFNENTSPKKYHKILTKIEEGKGDFVTVVGDILDDSKKVDPKIYPFFKSLTTITDKVVIIKGNHDDITCIKDSFPNSEWIENINDDFFEQLASFKNTHVLKNDNLLLKDYNINLIGLDFNGYTHYELEKEAQEDFIREANKNQPISYPAEYYNILLCHSPRNVMDKNITDKIELLKTINLIISGHMHNGMVPSWLEKYANFVLKIMDDEYYKNRGIIGPNSEMFPKLSRGEVDFNGIKGIIGYPMTAISETHQKSSKIANSFIAFPPAISRVKILKKNP